MKKILIPISVIVLIAIIYFSMIKEEVSVRNPVKGKVLKVIEAEVYKDLHREEDREQYVNKIIQVKGTVEKIDILNNSLIFEAVEGKIIAILQKGEEISEIMEEDQVVVRGIGVLDEDDENILKLITSIIVKNKN